MQTIKGLIVIFSGIIVEEESVEEEVEGSSKDEMEKSESDNSWDIESESEEEVEGSSKWTDRALMLQSGLLTALQVEEHKDGVCIQRIRAR